MDNLDDDPDPDATRDYVPTTVHALFGHEGVDDAPRAEQANTIRAWLRTHQLTPMMDYSIRMHGFAKLLDSHALATGPDDRRRELTFLAGVIRRPFPCLRRGGPVGKRRFSMPTGGVLVGEPVGGIAGSGGGLVMGIGRQLMNGR